MNVLSKTEFSKAHGVSRSAITQAVKSGAIAETPQGKIDLHHRDTVAWARNRTPKGNLDAIYAVVKAGKKSEAVARDAKKATKAAKVDKRAAESAARKSDKDKAKAVKEAAALQIEIDENAAAPGTQPDWDPENIPPLAEIKPGDLWKYPKASIDKLRIFEVALKTQQDREQKRGELISREVVSTVFSKIQAVDSGEWRTLEERLIPILCSVAGLADDDPRVLKIQKAINKETTRILRHTQLLVEKFLVSHAE